MQIVRTGVSWILAVLIAAVFLQSLFFKFTGHENSVHIFSQIDVTMVEWFGVSFFEPNMRIAVGVGEAIAAVLLLLPMTRFFGAALAFALMSGAIFFHLFTALGIAVAFPSADAPDPSLFVMACVLWVSSVILIVLHRSK